MTAADIRYDPAQHRSWLPDGTEIPHVTEVLRATGVATDFGALADRLPRVAEHLTTATALGTAIHADCHALDDGQLDHDAIDPRVRPYVAAWSTCRVDLGLTPVLHARERYVFHPTYRYGGIQDGLYTRAGQPDDHLIQIDLKSGGDVGVEFQTAAYCAAWEAGGGARIAERWCVRLTPECRVPYRVLDCTGLPDAAQHVAVFLACLTVYRYQAERRER